MQNDEKHVNRTDHGKTNHFATGPEEMCNPRFRNVDNQDLGPPASASEVNGAWAVEMPEFVPTSGELLVLAEHWTDVAIRRTYAEWAGANFLVSTHHWRRIYFAWRRVYRTRALLGEVIDQVIDDRIREFHDEDGGHWDPAEWQQFLRLVDRESQKKCLAPVEPVFRPPTKFRPRSETGD